MIDPGKFEEIKAAGQLPSPQGAAMRVMELCRYEGVALQEIVHTLNTDPAMAGQIIKVANSPVYGRSRPIIALKPEVVASLGLNTVRQLAIAFSLIGAYRQGRCKAFNYDDYWSHSVATAVAAESLGALVAAAPQAELFTCGLLSGIGRLALAAVYPDAYAGVLQTCSQQNTPQLSAAERDAFALDHAQLSAAMMEDWGIPKLFCDAVAAHEAPDNSEFSPGSRAYRLVWLFHLALRMAEVCFLDDHERAASLPRLFDIASNLAITPEQLVRVGDYMLSQWRDWSALLHTVMHETTPFSSLHVPTPTLPLTAGSDITNGVRLLLVDDDPALLLMLSKKLASLGYSVATASDLNQALTQFEQHHPHMVISDVLLPDNNGLDLCRALRNHPSGQSIYFMVLTAHRDVNQLVTAFEAGADDFLSKPIDLKVLLGRLLAGTRIVRLQQERELELRRLQAQANTSTLLERSDDLPVLNDPLTKLPNRRYAMTRLKEQWSLASRNGVPFACLRVSLDTYDDLREKEGQSTANGVLMGVANLLKSTSRLADVVCRLEEGEFLIIDPHSVIGTAFAYAERLLRLAAQPPSEGAGCPWPISFSVGVVSREAHVKDIPHLLQLAEQALQRAKILGGARAVAARIDPDDPNRVYLQTS